MSPALNTPIANAHIIELRQAASRRTRRDLRDRAERVSAAVTLKLAQADERDEVRLLAELDEEPALDGRVLVAYVEDKPVAALSLYDGRVVADPFVASADAVALLQVRAEHLLGARKHRRLRVIPRLRVA